MSHNGPANMGRLCSRFLTQKAGWRTLCLPIAIGSKNRDNLSSFLNKKAGNNLPLLSVLVQVLIVFSLRLGSLY
jgi:hypothetical protein